MVIRRTSSKVRQALFNILGDMIVGSNFLELFAGSGKVGIEALRRGAKSVVFVDKNTSLLKVPDCRQAGQEPAAVVLQMDTEQAMRRFYKEGRRFDIIFLDPPYFKGRVRKTLITLSQYDILTKVGLIIVEHYKKECSLCEGFRLVLQKRHGDTVLSFYEKTSGLSRDI